MSQRASSEGGVPDPRYVKALRRITALNVKRPAMSAVQPAGSPGAKRERLEKLLEGKR